MEKVTFRKIKNEHLSDVIRIHRESLPEDILPSLGDTFLKRYYDYVIELDYHSIYGIFEGDNVRGFCQVSRKGINLVKLLKKHPCLMLNILKLLFYRPIIFLSGVLLVLQRSRLISTLPEVAFIAVDEKFQGLGFGTQIIDFVTNAEGRGSGFLTTVTSNPVARKIYENKYNAQVTGAFSIFKKKYWQLVWCSEGKEFLVKK